jgi:hypothetical protein
MRKRELVYVHGLLAEVRSYIEESADGSLDTSYDEMEVTPASIHLGKAAHERAVFALAGDLAEKQIANDDQAIAAD